MNLMKISTIKSSMVSSSNDLRTIQHKQLSLLLACALTQDLAVLPQGDMTEVWRFTRSLMDYLSSIYRLVKRVRTKLHLPSITFLIVLTTWLQGLTVRYLLHLYDFHFSLFNSLVVVNALASLLQELFMLGLICKCTPTFKLSRSEIAPIVSF